MRNKPFAFAIIMLLVSSTTVAAQSQKPISNYSWRKSTTTTGSSQVTTPTQTSQTKSLSTQPNRSRFDRNSLVVPSSIKPNIPNSASLKRAISRVGFGRQAQDDPALNDTQPSASDQNLNTDQLPQTPTTEVQPVFEQPILDAPQVPGDVSAFDKAIPSPPTADFQYQQPALSIPANAQLPETNYCDRDCRNRDWCNLGCEKKLFGRHCSGLEMGGWMNLGYHNRDNIMLNNRKSEANLHQLWLYADKPSNGGIGYHIDALYGIDGQDLQAFGNEPVGAPDGWDNAWDNGSYGWALPTAYLTFERAGWDVKLGKFFSPFGYESVAATQNFFYSHSYSMYYSEPFTMTGILGERKVNNQFSTILGATLGWDTAFENANNGFNLITGMRMKPNEYVDLALTTSLGDSGIRDSGTMTSGVAQLQLTDSVDYVFQADVLNLGDNQEFGVVQYLFREINPCLGLGSRLEWWKSDQLFNGPTRSTWELTLGMNYRPHANIVLRPEVRFDWGAAAIDPGQPIVGIDAVMTF